MIIGLTGGIGSGKSTIASFFSDLGVPIYNSDLEAKKLMNTSESLKHDIEAYFGYESYSNGSLNKKFIADLVFSDKDKLAKLNSLVHPKVKFHFSHWKSQQNYTYVIQESALIFEQGSEDYYDKIILVTAPIEERIQRVMIRDNSLRSQILERIDNQLEDSKKVSLADFIIENKTLDTTRVAVSKLHQTLLDLSH